MDVQFNKNLLEKILPEELTCTIVSRERPVHITQEVEGKWILLDCFQDQEKWRYSDNQSPTRKKTKCPPGCWILLVGTLHGMWAAIFENNKHVTFGSVSI